MKCQKCKKEIKESFTSDNYEEICKECLEKEIYKKRKKTVKKYKR